MTGWDGNINSPHTIQDEYELARALGVERLTTDDDGQMIAVVEDDQWGEAILSNDAALTHPDPDDAAELVYGHDCEAQT